MAAVPIYVWNGTAWQETGPTIPANPIKYQASAPSSPSTGDIWVDSDGDVTTGSQQFQRFRFVASGGETTISGADANGAVLAYTAGLEQVVLNGAVLVRGHDYTATTGTTITGLSPALVASDVLEVFSFIAFTVANTYTQAQVDGLIAASTGLTLLNTTSFTASTGQVINQFSSTYKNYVVKFDIVLSASNQIRMRFTDSSGNVLTGGSYAYVSNYSNVSVAPTNYTGGSASTEVILFIPNTEYSGTIDFFNPYVSTLKTKTVFHGSGETSGYGFGAASYTSAVQNNGLQLYPSAGTFTGTVSIYGCKN
jgi:hypothetical protein